MDYSRKQRKTKQPAPAAIRSWSQRREVRRFIPWLAQRPFSAWPGPVKVHAGAPFLEKGLVEAAVNLLGAIGLGNSHTYFLRVR